jgi:hypothetical protein
MTLGTGLRQSFFTEINTNAMRKVYMHAWMLTYTYATRRRNDSIKVKAKVISVPSNYRHVSFICVNCEH